MITKGLIDKTFHLTAKKFDYNQMKFTWGILLIVAMQMMSGCRAYKRDLMLQFDENFSASDVQKSVDRAAANYVIRPGDYLSLAVFTNDGERLVDPNNELAGNRQSQSTQRKDDFEYLVLADGTCRFPMIGIVSVIDLTTNQAEELVQEAFDEYYKGSFVKLEPTNRRVVVLGATAGGGAVIPLPDENVSILEVLALAGGIEQGAKVESIKLIRGDLNNPLVFDMDMSTISGMKRGSMIVEPGDMIYVEPWRRPFRSTLQDISPILGLVSTTLTLVFVIQSSTTK